MPATALKPLDPGQVRRFALPDLDTHGHWLVPRLMVAYPQLSQRFIIGWIRNILYDNAYLFLFQNNGVALFQMTPVYSLTPPGVVIERFVFMKEGHSKEGVEFYAEALRWAQSLSVKEILVEEQSDVPHELIKDKIGRVFSREQHFVRVSA
jgi:hypothetical protein